ncbi:sensor histidine kinase [Flavobacterium sp. SUN052]|uniref:sensor histidine kinase n=1 Tax=Flavobacterium sp. SUN052 TaxID=3002441 RepID=UPI00237DC5FB|nr:sensor histidine kinase [Flavobacterium sp. SUN052]MEC4004339.1 sensor histidine kinase [Flavobacterium sp. SUN052]
MNSNFETEIKSLIFYVFSGFLLMAIVIVIFFYKSRKKIIEKELEKKDLEINHQKLLLRAVIITQEEERKRIAQDLHDDISSKLNIVSLNSHLLKTPNLSESELLEITDNIINLTTKALDNSRAIAHDLLPPVLEKFGLNAAIEELCLEFNTAKSVQVNYKSNIDFKNYQSDKELHIFRILQELMNNSLRHGKATIITILFDKIDETFVCEYKDNGVGFDINNLENQKGLGMKNIESRVSFINGTIEFSSEKNKGITVIINF